MYSFCFLLVFLSNPASFTDFDIFRFPYDSMMVEVYHRGDFHFVSFESEGYEIVLDSTAKKLTYHHRDEPKTIELYNLTHDESTGTFSGFTKGEGSSTRLNIRTGDEYRTVVEITQQIRFTFFRLDDPPFMLASTYEFELDEYRDQLYQQVKQSRAEKDQPRIFGQMKEVIDRNGTNYEYFDEDGQITLLYAKSYTDGGGERFERVSAFFFDPEKGKLVTKVIIDPLAHFKGMYETWREKLDSDGSPLGVLSDTPGFSWKEKGADDYGRYAEVQVTKDLVNNKTFLNIVYQ